MSQIGNGPKLGYSVTHGIVRFLRSRRGRVESMMEMIEDRTRHYLFRGFGDFGAKKPYLWCSR
jgi:hypothetical protein